MRNGINYIPQTKEFPTIKGKKVKLVAKEVSPDAKSADISALILK